jgi:hypothetical protein
VAASEIDGILPFVLDDVHRSETIADCESHVGGTMASETALVASEERIPSSTRDKIVL